MIRNTQSLGFPPCYKRELEGVPSWVPDWRYCIRDGHSDLASTGQPCVRISSDGQRLELQGIKFGRVAAVVRPASISAWIDSQALFSRSTGKEVMENDDGSIVARGILAVIRGIQELKRLCLAAAVVASPSITDDVFQKQWEAFWKRDTDDSMKTQIDMVEGRREIDLLEVMQGIPGAYFISLAETMDAVCMLRGMGGPCVLRRSGCRYSLVGECDMTSLGLSVRVRERVELHQTETFVLV
jgi:hypothetical protein